MNIHEHGVPHSANEIARNIKQFGNDIALRRKFGRHFLVAKEINVAQSNILTESTSHEMHITQQDFTYQRSPVRSRACTF